MKDKSEEDDAPSIDALIKVNNDKHSDPLENSVSTKDSNEIKKHLKSATRSKEWYNASATKLNVLIQQLHVLKRHSHHKVRKEMVENINLLLTTCSR